MSPDAFDHDGARRWRLDPDLSTAEFRVPNFWGLMKVRGRFDRLSGWLEIGEQGQRRIELTIDATSLNTGNDKRDEHLRSDDFFDTPARARHDVEPARDDPDPGGPHGSRAPDT